MSIESEVNVPAWATASDKERLQCMFPGDPIAGYRHSRGLQQEMLYEEKLEVVSACIGILLLQARYGLSVVDSRPLAELAGLPEQSMAKAA